MHYMITKNNIHNQLTLDTLKNAMRSWCK